MPTKRPYLRAPDRRRQLLDAAGALFDRSGFGGITMAGTATEAGVSRQLVYDHFGDVGTLCEAFVTDRLARYRTGLPDISGLDADRATAAMFHHLVSIPAKDRRVVRLLVADVGLPALDRIRRRFHDDELARRPRASASVASAADVERASAMLWVDTSALLALADAVTNGELSGAEATAIAVRIVRATSAAGPPPS